MNFQQLKQQSKIHFIGIGGIGMSALALILHEFNIAVQGSDLSENYLTSKLRELGITYFVGHKAENISNDVSLVIQTSIIKSENPEILEAQKRNIPIITRANLLAIVMANYKGISIAGTHGKTSTTAITSIILEIANLDPTIINGGIIHYFGSNSKVGKGEFLVAESDESDGSFVELPSFIGAITNIEPEHLEFSGYGGDFEKQKAYFERYVNQIPAAGLCVLCIDSTEVEKIYHQQKQKKNNLFSYSINKEADLKAQNIKLSVNGLVFDAIFKNGKKIENISMPIYGKHNVSNALAAIAIGNFLEISHQKIKEALEKFNGVKRRFTKVGEYSNAAIIDDYAHHPTEITATLKAARSLAQKHKIICVVQPHKFTRLRDLFSEFCNAFSDADIIIVSDIYSAGQSPIPGITQDALVNGIKKTPHQKIIKLSNEKDLAKLIKNEISSGDLIICLGAGNITYWAAALEQQLKNL
jgi:UDP-N-acetylmuramate--alanine ligase